MTSVDIYPTITAEHARQLTDRIKTGVEAIWHLVEDAYRSRAWAALGYSSWDDYCTREFGTSRLTIPREERPERVNSLREAGMSIRAIRSATGLAKDTIAHELQVSQSGTPAPEPLLVDRRTGEVLPEPPHEQEAEPEFEPSGLDEFVDDEPEPDEPLPDPEPDPEPDPIPAPRVTGTDGKSYPAELISKPRRPELAVTVRALSMDLYRLTNRVQKLRGDDRLTRNKVQVASLLRGHLTDAIEVYQDLLDALTPQEGV